MNELLSDPTPDDDESRRLSRFDRIRPRGRNALRHHHCSVVLFGSSGYRGVAAMIACAWVEPLTGTDENTCDNTEEVPVVKMRLTAVNRS
jgi:hypothetical protein